MSPEDPSTRWTVIRDAAEGDAAARAEFAARYAPVVRAYLGARWRRTVHEGDVDDAVQDVFIDCFREGGALVRVDSEAPAGFRAYLHGIARNVALRAEERRRRERARGADVDPDELEGREDSASRLFDRAWAETLLTRATALLAERAARAGDAALSRIELLRLRFEEDLPIREIAQRRNEDAARVHRDYAVARGEFQQALRDVVREHEGGSPGEVERECARLLDFLR